MFEQSEKLRTELQSKRIGHGPFQYEALADWEVLPLGMSLCDAPGVAINSRDEVVVLTRNIEHPGLIFSPQGELLREFGKDSFGPGAHGLSVAPDDTMFCTDIGTHSVTQWSSDGELLLTIGSGGPAERWSGLPFNMPTHAVVSPTTGRIYVSDGYGNARVHRYNADGELELSWGEPGTGPGQFNRPHNVAIDHDDRILVADRESHRVQLFDSDGRFLDVWNNIHRPNGLVIGPEGNVYICELNGMDATGPNPSPGLGHCVSIFSPRGKLLARFGGDEEGEEPGKFIAPHGIAVDSRGDIYVGEVSNTLRYGLGCFGHRELKSLRKLRRTSPLLESGSFDS